jgi:integrase/recombinase XerD
MRAYLEPPDIARMEEAAGSLRDRILIKMLFRTGCRISEALGLEVKDIDFADGTVVIQHLKAHIKLNCSQCGARLGKSHMFCPKCGITIDKPSTQEQQHKRMRTLPLDKETLDLLADFIKRGGPVEKNGKLLLFAVNRHRGWGIIKHCAEKTGLPKLTNPESGRAHYVSPHRLRDAFAVHAVKSNDSGDGLRLLQEHLGHASFNTTAKYRKVAGTEHREWYDSLWRMDANGATT